MDNKIKENQEVGSAPSHSAAGAELAALQQSEAQKPRAELLESLSAMMDDEAEALETRRIVKSLEYSPELLNHWRRYHAVRAGLQHELHTTPSIDLLASVKARLAGEAANSNTARSFTKPLRVGGMFRLAGQGLIAATVAAAVLITYPMLTLTQNDAGNAAPALIASQPTQTRDTLPQMNGDYSASPLTRTVSLDDAARRRLENAVRNFSGTTAVLNSSNSAMFVNQLEPFASAPPAAPVVSPTPEQPVQRR